MDEMYIVKKVTITSDQDRLYIVQGNYPQGSVVGWTDAFIGEGGVFVGVKFISIGFVLEDNGLEFSAYMAKWGIQYPPHGINFSQNTMLRDLDEIFGGSTPSIQVQWGDGSQNGVFEPPFDGVTITHTYAEPGEYQIVANMEMPYVQANDLWVSGYYTFTAVE